MQVLISSLRPVAALTTNSGSARKGRAIDTMSALPRANMASPTSGVLMRLEVITGMVNALRTLAVTQVKAARGTLVAMVGMRASCQPMPVLMIDVHGPQKKPFGKLTEALDQLQPGDIYLASGGDMRCAYWGEILTATARTRGAEGAVIHGYHRDTPRVLEQNWPVFMLRT